MVRSDAISAFAERHVVGRPSIGSMTKTIRIVHPVLMTVVAVASLAVGVATGIGWAGAAVGAVLGSRVARSVLLLTQPDVESDGARRTPAIVTRAHGVGYLIAAFLFVGSALQREIAVSGVLAAASFVAAVLNLWLARKMARSAT